MRLFSNVWSENTALFERLMEIHSNSPKLYYGFKWRVSKIVPQLRTAIPIGICVLVQLCCSNVKASAVPVTLLPILGTSLWRWRWWRCSISIMSFNELKFKNTLFPRRFLDQECQLFPWNLFAEFCVYKNSLRAVLRLSVIGGLSAII